MAYCNPMLSNYKVMLAMQAFTRCRYLINVSERGRISENESFELAQLEVHIDSLVANLSLAENESLRMRIAMLQMKEEVN